MNALVYGSKEVIGYIDKSLEKAFGSGVIEIVQLNEAILRTRMRLVSTGRSAETVLTVLNSEGINKCKDMIQDLESLEEGSYCGYENVGELLSFLNNRFGMDFELEEKKECIGENAKESVASIDKSVLKDLEYYKGVAKDRGLRVMELTKALEELDLGNENAEVSREINSSKWEEQIVVLKKEREELQNFLEKANSSKDSLSRNLELVTAELDEYKVKYSMQTGIINSKEEELRVLKEKYNENSGESARISELEEELEVKLGVWGKEKDELLCKIANYEGAVAKLKAENTESSIRYSKKEEALQGKVSELEKEKEEYTEKVEELQSTIKELEGNIEKLNSKGSELEEGYKEKEELAKDERKKVEEELQNLKKRYISLEGNFKDLESTILELNKEKLEIEQQLEVLQKSTSRDTDIEGILSELAEVKQNYDSISLSTFGRLASLKLPSDKLGISVLNNVSVNDEFKDFRFVFSGSTDSRKGMYKCLLSEMSQVPENSRVVILDIVSETSIDYVFEMSRLKSGSNWLKDGGNIENYLSPTKLPNVSVLSAGGTGYINEAFFLSIDWVSRLRELRNLGWIVIIVCGDISNVTGRVLHESFASIGMSHIYVQGNAVCSRAVITNIRGLSNAKDSIICYYEFNKKVQNLFDIASRTCQCQIIG